MNTQPPFYSPLAKFLLRLCRAVRTSNSPEDHHSESQSVVDLRLPIPDRAKNAVARAIMDSNQFADTKPAIRIPPVFITGAVRHLALSRDSGIEYQYLVFSISADFASEVLLTPAGSDDANVTRQLVTLSVPTEVAQQLVVLSLSTDSAHQGSDSNAILYKDELRRLISLCTSSHPPPAIVPNTSILSATDLSTVAKLLRLFESGFSTRRSAVHAFSGVDLLAAHKLLDRFAWWPRNPHQPAGLDFTTRDVAAAHRLRDLFACDDSERAVGPIFLAFPYDHQTGKPLRLVQVSGSELAARHLLELSPRS